MNYKLIQRDSLLRMKINEDGFAKIGDVVRVVAITNTRLTVRNVRFQELTYDFTILAEAEMDLFDFAGGEVEKRPIDALQEKIDGAVGEAKSEV